MLNLLLPHLLHCTSFYYKYYSFLVHYSKSVKVMTDEQFFTILSPILFQIVLEIILNYFLGTLFISIGCYLILTSIYFLIRPPPLPLQNNYQESKMSFYILFIYQIVDSVIIDGYYFISLQNQMVPTLYLFLYLFISQCLLRFIFFYFTVLHPNLLLLKNNNKWINNSIKITKSLQLFTFNVFLMTKEVLFFYLISSFIFTYIFNNYFPFILKSLFFIISQLLLIPFVQKQLIQKLFKKNVNINFTKDNKISSVTSTSTGVKKPIQKKKVESIQTPKVVLPPVQKDDISASNLVRQMTPNKDVLNETIAKVNIKENLENTKGIISFPEEKQNTILSPSAIVRNVSKSTKQNTITPSVPKYEKKEISEEATGIIGERLKKESNNNKVSNQVIEKSNKEILERRKNIKRNVRKKTTKESNIVGLINNLDTLNKLDVPKEDNFKKLEEFAKLEKKHGVEGALQMKREEKEKELSEKTEEPKVTVDNSKDKKPTSGISLQAVLAAKSRLRKTGEDLQ
ncbi:hypothetical protein ABK040_009790 [Willaertia magna]